MERDDGTEEPSKPVPPRPEVACGVVAAGSCAAEKVMGGSGVTIDFRIGAVGPNETGASEAPAAAAADGVVAAGCLVADETVALTAPVPAGDSSLSLE